MFTEKIYFATEPPFQKVIRSLIRDSKVTILLQEVIRRSHGYVLSYEDGNLFRF